MKTKVIGMPGILTALTPPPPDHLECIVCEYREHLMAARVMAA